MHARFRMRSPQIDKLFVSVIVPTHGRAVLLRRLLHSLLAQNWPADCFEIIIVDNLADHDTDRVVSSIAATTMISISHHHVSSGSPGSSRQFGAEQARGSVLAFIDDDCEAT